MTSAAPSTYLPPLEAPHEREGVAHELEATLHGLVDLALIGTQLHWAVLGPLFRPPHQQLDELVDSLRELADTVAERAVAVGVVPDGPAKAVVAGSQLVPAAASALEDRLVVREIAHRISELSELTRERMNRLGEVDLASHDVLVEVVRTLEKQQWMLRVQLGERL